MPCTHNAIDPMLVGGPALRAIEVPTMWLAGGPPSHVDQRELMQMAAQIRSSEFVEVPVGHNIHADAPDEFIRTVRAFFAKNGL
jgi:pimeloyl-ACP methyl ester carboxylesterase